MCWFLSWNVLLLSRPWCWKEMESNWMSVHFFFFFYKENNLLVIVRLHYGTYFYMFFWLWIKWYECCSKCWHNLKFVSCVCKLACDYVESWQISVMSLHSVDIISVHLPWHAVTPHWRNIDGICEQSDIWMIHLYL